MKPALAIFIFLTLGLSKNKTHQPSLLKISTFKHVPENMMGCGDDCYLSAKDEKTEILICRTDYASALIHIDNKSVVLDANQTVTHDVNEEIYTSGQYILSLKMTCKKQIGDEDYTFKGILTIKSGATVLYQQTVFGDGGC